MVSRMTAQASSMRYDLLDEDPEEVPEKGGDPQEEREQESEGSHTQLSQQEAECTHADAMPHSPQDDLPQEGGQQTQAKQSA